MVKVVKHYSNFGIIPTGVMVDYVDWVVCAENKYLCFVDFVHYLNTGIDFEDLLKCFYDSVPKKADYCLHSSKATLYDYAVLMGERRVVRDEVDLNKFLVGIALGFDVEKICNKTLDELQDELLAELGPNSAAAQCVGNTRFGYVYLYGDKLFQVTAKYADKLFMRRSLKPVKTGLSQVLENHDLPKIDRVPVDVFNYVNNVTLNAFLKMCNYPLEQVNVSYDPLKDKICIETFARGLNEDAKKFDVIVSTEKCLTSEILQAHKPAIIKAANSVAKTICKDWGYSRKEFEVYDLKVNRSNDFKVSYQLKTD